MWCRATQKCLLSFHYSTWSHTSHVVHRMYFLRYALTMMVKSGDWDIRYKGQRRASSDTDLRHSSRKIYFINRWCIIIIGVDSARCLSAEVMHFAQPISLASTAETNALRSAWSTRSLHFWSYIPSLESRYLWATAVLPSKHNLSRRT